MKNEVEFFDGMVLGTVPERGVMKKSVKCCAALLFAVSFALPAGAGDIPATGDRIIFSKTALTPAAGELSATGYLACLWDVNYTVNSNLSTGVFVNLPFYVLGAFPHVDANFRISDNWCAGSGAMAGAISSYADNPDREGLFASAAHLAATGVYGRHLINFNTTVIGVSDYSKKKLPNIQNGTFYLPNIGYRFTLNTTWSFLVEGTSILGTADNAERNGELWVINYGMRIAGANLFGDVGFVFPAIREYLENTWKFTPFGIPYFTLGYRF